MAANVNTPCAKCGAKNKTSADSYCRPCRKEYSSAWYLRNKEKHVDKGPRTAYMREWRYGITQEQFDALLASQGGHCALCDSTKSFHVDHCHKTGRVRGILCVSHNTALGRFEDDPFALETAAMYLRGH